jgi:hypothetical protein
VFWPDDGRPGIALKVKLVERGGQSFYAWGVIWACGHPASDPLGAIQAIMDSLIQAPRAKCPTR